MANDRLYRENVTFLLCQPEAFANRAAPTAAELNQAAGAATAWWNYTTNSQKLVHNITCALNEDGTDFTLGDSDMDSTVTFCDKAGVQTPTFYNPTVMFEAFRDADKDSTSAGQGEFNEAYNLLAFAGAEYIAVLRIGQKSNTPFAINDIVKMVAVKTDVGIDVGGSGENLRISQSFLPNDFVNWNFKLVA
jgi:hypothetical protein